MHFSFSKWYSERRPSPCGPAFLCLERSPFDAHFRSRPTAARGRVARFALSSLFSAGVDLAAFELLCRLLEDAAGEAAAIVAATCIARAASALVNHVINYVLVFHSHAARGRATGLYALITVGKTLCSALLVAAAAALVPALPRLGAKMGADVLLFFVNYLLQKAFVY